MKASIFIIWCDSERSLPDPPAAGECIQIGLQSPHIDSGMILVLASLWISGQKNLPGHSCNCSQGPPGLLGSSRSVPDPYHSPTSSGIVSESTQSDSGSIVVRFCFDSSGIQGRFWVSGSSPNRIRVEPPNSDATRTRPGFDPDSTRILGGDPPHDPQDPPGTPQDPKQHFNAKKENETAPQSLF